MTAEIAVLNKSAVALAADSAITLSVGSNQHKVFDSEDKLFELSTSDPLGIMINNSMHFMEAPLPVLIKSYRREADRFPKVQDAAQGFLSHLHAFGVKAPRSVVIRGVQAWIGETLALIEQRFQSKVNDRFQTPFPEGIEDYAAYFAELRNIVLSEQISVVHRVIETLPKLASIGESAGDDGATDEAIDQVIKTIFGDVAEAQEAELRAVAIETLNRAVSWTPRTGVIVAGFGQDELFPTLVSFEVYGMLKGQLRLHQTNDIDIDREGTKAKVIPFAQKEMVERFLYGLDDGIQRKIQDFCKTALPSIREKTMSSLDMAEADRVLVEGDMEQAEQIFLNDLRERTFDAIREESERDIELMVEFMPKPEMARMAEALVNLTSIKRRVSRGMETVGGPIDCAVISRSDGFVWVKRKHYFPGELNGRYFDRMRAKISSEEEV